MFSKSYIISLLELILYSTGLNYGLLDATYFTNAEENFIQVTSLHDRKLTGPNIKAQLNQCHEKRVNIHCEEKNLWSWLILQNFYEEAIVAPWLDKRAVI